jgi:hypothetical protein
MTQKSFFTVGQLADRFNEPQWKVRRAVDSLDTEVPRAGQYRLVPAEMLPAIGAKLHPSHTEPSVCK